MRSWLKLAAVLTLSPSLGAGQELPRPIPSSRPSFWQAAGGVLAANGVTWGYNWYVQRWHWAKVGTNSWAANLEAGFVWDNDCFMDNQLAHPYHGSIYLGSARASGYGFWGSIPYVAAGSATWELFFENVRPSLNDFVNTTLGGLALGEVTFRLSSLLVPRQAKRGQGFGRQIGAFVLSPVARAQNLLLGSSREAQTGGSPPAMHLSRIAVGALRDRLDPALGTGANRRFLELAIEYGSPFDESAVRPFDAFEFRLQYSQGPTKEINHLEVSGLLARRDVRRSERSQLTLGLFQHYDYHDNAPYEFGGQSVSGALLYRRELGSRVQLDLGAHVEALLLGAISSDHGQYFRRDYDYGSGMGGRLSVSLRRDGRELLQFEHRTVWLHSLHGADADHLITSARLGTVLPLSRLVQLGGDIGLLIRHSSYRGFDSNSRRASQLRAYLLWSPF
jgi:uncharacterized protein DUF3943